MVKIRHWVWDEDTVLSEKALVFPRDICSMYSKTGCNKCNDNTLQYVLQDKEDVERGPQAVGSTSSLRKRGMLNRKIAIGVLTQVYESSKEKNLE